MSRGHGRIQQKILQYFNFHKEVSIQDLIDFVYDTEYWNYSSSQYQSVCRAVRKLKEKGLVETYFESYDTSKWLMIKKKS